MPGLSSPTCLRPAMPADQLAANVQAVEDKLRRRLEVAKMSRRLQDRLALASYKSTHGLDHMSFSLVEAHVGFQHHYHHHHHHNQQQQQQQQQQYRKPGRARASSNAVSTNSSSSTSSTGSDIHLPLPSSPTTAPTFSDDIYGDNGIGSKKRPRFQMEYLEPSPPRNHESSGSTNGSRKRRSQYSVRSSSPTNARSWKSKYNLPESSPPGVRFHPEFRSSDVPELSFFSATSNGHEKSPPLGPSPVSDAPSLPAIYRGSPPRTPPPPQAKGLKNRKNGVTALHNTNANAKSHTGDNGNGNGAGGEEGADLLLYLATSPSPANYSRKATIDVNPPSTPPSKHAALSSSVVNTPGLFGISTPGQPFNFADFVNVTPSPAQVAFGGRTPAGFAAPRTPLAGREARAKINFDALIAPQSPSTGRVSSGSSSGATGLGMELGGELGV